MWKRKRNISRCCGGSAGSTGETIVYPALESTLLVESGLDSGTPVNSVSTYVTSGMNGVKRIIYDGTYWNNDFYITNYENTAAAILVTTYQSGDTFTTLFPIVLPRQILASTSTSFLKKQESIAYALNLLFSKPGYVVHTFAGPYPYQYIPLLINDFLPILQTATLPPLLWKVIPQTGQLALVVNPTYVHPDPTFQIAFSVITLPSLYQGDQSVSSGNVQITDPEAGWFADGGYIFGYGTLNYDTHLFDDSMARNPSYAALLKTLDLGDKIPMTLVNWQAMVSALGLSYVISCGERTLSCIASKYYKVQSSALARIQKRNITTNILGGEFSETIGIVYNSVLSSGQYQDSPSSAPIIHFNPHMNGNNLIDLEWKDEWGNSMNPFPTNQPGAMSFFENTDSAPTYPPAAYQPLDPFFTTNGPNYDCLFPYYKINQDMVVFPVSGSGYKLPVSSVYSCKYSSSISHFIRLIGS